MMDDEKEAIVDYKPPRKQPGLRLRIEGDGLTTKRLKFFLEGIDISSGLREASLHFSADGVNEAVINLLVNGIELDAQALVALQAHLEKDALRRWTSPTSGGA